MALDVKNPEHWLKQYGNHYHVWKKSIVGGRTVYARRLGLVESSFDADGRYYEGLADVNANIAFELRNNLTREEFRQRMLLIWTILRLQHTSLSTRTDLIENEHQVYFHVDVPRDTTEAISSSSQTVHFIDDDDIDADDFFRHCTNTGRVIDVARHSSKLFVFPLKALTGGTHLLRLIQVTAHSNIDGLSANQWLSKFMKLLNTTKLELDELLEQACSADAIWSRLPPAQEDLYPPIAGNIARQRWFWAIMIILRHTRKLLPRAFPNPLRSLEASAPTKLMPQKYGSLLNYSSSHIPPRNSLMYNFSLSPTASDRLISLSREAEVSVGAGCFALLGMAMMELEEELYPNVSIIERKCMIASFPLNPRPFFAYDGPPDSCMLAFSDGLYMGWVSSDLDITGRFRLLAKQAHRQLRQYQKKKLRTSELSGGLGAHSTARILAHNYITAVERCNMKLPSSMRKKVNPQGAYPANWGEFFFGTCGHSAVGNMRGLFDPKKRDLSSVMRKVVMGVRAREGEFLVGSSSDENGIHFNVSYDASTIPEDNVGKWKAKMQVLLDTGGKSRL
ncbi:hypothetical protein M501DRAFT_1007279 [Patellaria atrata CBS 101060]|uniref:Uncharacterized protein n=1 Tax=Patellaria atrata CBS 101060 TaxID=1346257 RepID=A0A9P4S626_9PEZI|nr:hypothetical protein M501DRAFT_1007279 [Patellaria atrata CBS 101060]